MRFDLILRLLAVVSLLITTGCDDLSFNGVPANTDCDDPGSAERARQGCRANCEEQWRNGEVSDLIQCQRNCEDICRSRAQLQDNEFSIDTRIARLFAGSEAPKIRLVASQDVAAEIAAKTSTQDATDCEKHCDSNGPYCLRAQLSEQDGLSTKLVEAKSIFSQATTKVIKADVARLFGVQDDPCLRSDTFFVGDKTYNTGESCILDASIEEKEAAFVAQVHLPSVLVGERSKEGDRLVVRFDDSSTSPVLAFGPENDTKAAAYQKDFGGAVSRILVTSKRAVVSTEQGCVAVSLETK